MSAGHCFPGGGTVENHDRARLGGVAFSSVPANGGVTTATDSARIFLDSQSAFGPTRWTWHRDGQRHPVTQRADATEMGNAGGRMVCEDGALAGTRCGAIDMVLTTASFSRVRNDDTTRLAFTRHFQYGANVCAGDSGGPAHDPIAGDANRSSEAFGIQSSGRGGNSTPTNGQECFNDATAGRLPDVQGQLDVTVKVD